MAPAPAMTNLTTTGSRPSLLLGVVLRHDATLDLAGRGARDGLGDVDLLRPLEVGQTLLAEGQQVGLRHGLLQLYRRGHFLAPGGMWRAEAHRLGHRRMR